MPTRKQPGGLEVLQHFGDASLYEATKHRIGTELQSSPVRLAYHEYALDATRPAWEQVGTVVLLLTGVEAVWRGDTAAIKRIALGRSN